MVISTIADFVNILGTVLYLLIIARALLSWFGSAVGSSITQVLVDVTEPILGPLRRVLPPVGGLDLSPIVALVLISVVKGIIISVLYSAA